MLYHIVQFISCSAFMLLCLALQFVFLHQCYYLHFEYFAVIRIAALLSRPVWPPFPMLQSKRQRKGEVNSLIVT